MQSPWKPRPTLRGILKTSCLRVDPSCGNRAGLLYASPCPTVIGHWVWNALERGHHLVWCNQLRESLKMAEDWGLSTKDSPRSWENQFFILKGWGTLVVHHSVDHKHWISRDNKDSVRYHLSNRVWPTNLWEVSVEYLSRIYSPLPNNLI